LIVFDIFKPKKQRNKKAQSLEKSVFPRLFLLLNYFLKMERTTGIEPANLSSISNGSIH